MNPKTTVPQKQREAQCASLCFWGTVEEYFLEIDKCFYE